MTREPSPPPASTSTHEPRALTGIRVLDLTRLLPGPLATLALADMGAVVDKLEDPGAGDYLRHMGPMAGPMSGPFRVLNRDKRMAVLDLKHRRGAEVLRTLVRAYDVLVESFRPGVLDRLGIGHAALLAENPRLVIAAITGYGQKGPLAHRAGHDLNYLARAGVLGATGPRDAPPAVSGVQMADVAGGAQWAVTQIVAALFARERTGRGRVIDVSMCEGSIPLGAFAYGAHAAEREGFQRGESFLDGGIAPYRCYRTSDARYVALAALEPKFWIAFCNGVGIEPVMDALMPGAHQATWHERLEALFEQRTRDEWAAFGATHDCCLEPVLTAHELASDPQHGLRGVFFDLEGTPHFRTPGTPADAVHTPARAPGADTRAVLHDAGLDDATVDELAREGVLGSSGI